jgi:chorismate mutase / prephenate dehydratase
MASKKVSVGKAGAGQVSLSKLRAQIDKIDLELLRLMNDRARVAEKVGQVKEADNMPIFSPEREDAVLERLIGLNKGPLPRVAVEAVFRELMSASRSLQKRMKVAFLGPEYSFSHLAAIQRFGLSVEFIPAGSIAGVFEAVHRHQAELGIVPIENSTDGRIVDTLDMFFKLPLKIRGEVSMKIEHHLLAMCPQSSIQRIYSKPQVLSQCRHWLATHVPQAQLMEVASSSTAVELAKREPGAAAIASRESAVAHGLDILVSGIEDRSNNVTRFAILGHETAPRTGRDKTSLMMEIKDASGALYDALSAFKRNRVNMSWIESFPAETEGKQHRYVFFVDIEGHESDLRVKRALAALDRRTSKVVVLGTFPRARSFE